MGLAHYAAAQACPRAGPRPDPGAAGAPTVHHVELAWKNFAYDYERLCLPLAEGSGLPPMVLTFITCSIPKSREFWERYAEGESSSP